MRSVYCLARPQTIAHSSKRSERKCWDIFRECRIRRALPTTPSSWLESGEFEESRGIGTNSRGTTGATRWFNCCGSFLPISVVRTREERVGDPSPGHNDLDTSDDALWTGIRPHFWYNTLRTIEPSVVGRLRERGTNLTMRSSRYRSLSP